MRRRALALLSALAMTISGGVVPVAAVADSHPAVVPELKAAAGRLAETSLVPELVETVPGFGTNMGLLLGLHDAFGALAGIDDFADIAALDVAGFTFQDVVEPVGEIPQGSFDLVADRAIDAELMLVEDAVQLIGDEVAGQVSLDPTTVAFEYDDSRGPGEAFALVDLPTFELDVAIDETVSLPVQFGFADASAEGQVSLHTTVAVALADPDGDGRLTSDELATLAIEDLVELDFPAADDGTDDLDIDLTVTADVFGTIFSGSVTVNDPDLFDDDQAAIDFQADGDNPIDLLTNIGPDLAITALAQYLSGYGLAMIGGDVQIPLLEDGVFVPGDLGDLDDADFDQVFDAVKPIVDYIEPRSAGQIVCGPTVTAPEDGDTDGIPAGRVRNLEAGDVVHCRAYTAADADDVAWSFANATVDNARDEDVDTIGVEPTRNVTVVMDDDGELAVSLEYTPEDATDAVTVLPRPDTIQELLAELGAAGLLPTVADVPLFDYEPDLEAFTLPISTTVDTIERSATANAGNSLVADTGLTGLTASADSAVDLTIGPIEAAMTLGLIVTDDVASINPEDGDDADEDEPGPGDRFFVRAPEPVLTVDEVALEGTIGLQGRLGFLEVDADGTGSLSRPDDTAPAVEVGLTDPLGVTVGGHTDETATLLRDLLRQGPVDSITGAVNLALDADLEVTSSAAGMNVSGTASVDWDLDEDAPLVTTDGDFEADLLPFDRADEFTYDDVGGDDPTLFTTTGTRLLDMPGLVGAYLVDDNDDRCQITAVVSDTSLRCTDLQSGDDDPAIEFADGETYTVRGNTLSHLTEILAALEQLVAYLDEVVGEDRMREPLPVVGISPADLVGQVEELRRLIDQFRGVQAARIECGVQGASGADIRALEVAPGTSATLECGARGSIDDARDVRWRVAGRFGDGVWHDADAGTVGSEPDTTELTVSAPSPGDPGADLPTDTDGYVALGAEYTIEVEWTDRNGGREAALPPRTPRSLQGLAQQVTDALDLPEDALAFVLENSDPTLRINLGYGICSETAPDDLPDDGCEGMPTGPSPDVDLNADLGGTLSFATLGTSGDVDVRYGVLGQFDVGIPLDGAAPVLYGTTGLQARVQVTGTDLGVDVNVGPARGVLGAGGPTIEGTAQDGSEDDTLVDEATDLDEVPLGAVVERTSGDAGECFVSSITDADELSCDLDWEPGDDYRIGGQSRLEAGIAFDVEVTEGGSALADDATVPIPDAGVSFTDLEQFLAGDADCGGIDASNSDDVVTDADGDDDSDLTGFACGRLSVALEIGTDAVFLGELGLDLDSGGLTVWVPADLLDRLEDALDFGLILRTLPPMLQSVEQELRDFARSGIPAAIGDPLRTSADGIAEIRSGVEGVIDTFGDTLDAATDPDDLESLLTDELEDLIGAEVDLLEDVGVTAYCGADECEGDENVLEVTRLEAELSFGETLEAGTGINLGMAGLPLSIEAGVEAAADWSVEFGLGISVEQGPYLAVDDDASEASIGAEVSLSGDGADCSFSLAQTVEVAEYGSDRCLRGQLGFVFLQAQDSIDNPTGVSAEVGLDLVPATGDVLTLSELLALDFDVTVDDSGLGDVTVDLAFRTGLGGPSSPDMPSILGTFQLGWDATTGDFEIAFDDLHLDVGTFVTGFLEPIIGEIRNVTGPLQPIVDVIMAPIPVVTDLAELVGSEPITMVSILEEATGSDLSLIRAIAAFIDFINQVGALDDDAFQLPLGEFVGDDREPGAFQVDPAAAATSVSPDDAGKLIDRTPGTMTAGSGMTADIADDTGLSSDSEADGRPATFGVPGLSFPFLDDASQAFGILVGRDAVLVRWDAGTLEAAAGLSYDFGPIMVGPIPITITIGGEIGVKGRFAIGYDTSGIRRQLDGGSGVALFDGIFIDDLDADGNDVDEITFFGRVFAGAAVDLVIVSAGAAGGIELTFALNLDDRPDPDGKLRIEEIVDKLSNPICLFEVSGRIEAFLEAFVEIDLFLTSKRYSLELVRITLLEWSDACEPPSPVLAEDDGEVLYLNVGDRRDRRNVAENVTDEQVEVRQLGDGRVRVSGFGAEAVFDDVGLIVADAGIGDDELLFLAGSADDSAEDDEIPFDIPVVVSGGPGSDIVRTGSGPDRILGDSAIDAGTWESIAYDAFPAEDSGDDEDLEPGRDQVNAGAGQDVITGDGDDDRIDGQLGADTILGGEGDDRLSGGPGDDRILGEAGDDQLQGGPIEQPDAGEDPGDDDAIAGGPDEDTVSGDLGDDVLFGDEPADGFFTVDEDTLRHTFATPAAADWRGWCDDAEGAADIIIGNDGDDWIVGGGDDDQVDAGSGDDHACGSAGDDEILGGDGSDELRGNADADDLFGDNGHDLVFGGAGDDVAEGGDGNDDIFGDDGADLLDGGADHDIVVGDTGSVPTGTHTHAPGSDGALDASRIAAIATEVVRDSTSGDARRTDCARENGIGDSDCLTGGSGSDALFGGSDGDIVTGDGGLDLLEGNDGPDLLRGGTESDLLFGNGGADELFGDSADDELYGDRPLANWQDDLPAGAAPDRLFGGPGDDHLEGDGDDDTAFGGAGDDHVEGNDHDDELHGQGGDDDLIGGSDTAGEPDGGETLVSGGPGTDVIAGDNAEIGPDGIVGGRSVQLLDPTIGGGDHLEGDAGSDFAFGGPGGDTIHGDHGPNGPFSGTPAADYVEGNDGADTIHGEDGADDLVGGSSAADGAITADRDGNGTADAGETLVAGGAGRDWVAGDNARMNRVLLGTPDYPDDGAADFDPIVLFDLSRADAAAAATAFGADTLRGDGGSDLMFGQGGNDTVHGGDDDDYAEGNDGDDRLHGEAGDDDLVGGGSAADGVIDRDRDGATLHDGGETIITGGDGIDWIAGDNAFMNRVLFADADAPIRLFDVNSDDPAVSGGDTIDGGPDADRAFGQGNGAQDPGQSDPPDGVDNDGDGAVDEDDPWHGDVIAGAEGDDYLEGNHGGDLIDGGAGDDDIAGGGSAIDGVIDADRVGDGLLDARDSIHGGTGDDVAGGDNVRILPADAGPLWVDNHRHVSLFDVNAVDVSISGGDFVSGGDGDDVAFGQGNGAQQPAQADPRDGYDNDLDGREDGAPADDRDAYDCADGADNDGNGDGDGADPDCAALVDEDQPWDGDILHGDAGHDYLEGNHGADWMFGGDGQDDLIGGGSAIDGVIDADRSGVGLTDESDVVHGNASHDVITGDNAAITRTAGAGAWQLVPGGDGSDFPIVLRDVSMAEAPEGEGHFDDDHLLGGTGHDHLYGQQGHDLIEGGEDDDTVVGDLGRVESQVEDGSRAAHIEPRQPFVEDDVFAAGTLTNVTTLFAQRTGEGAEGDDIVLGGEGHDDLHGGPGHDIVNGDRYADPPDPDLIDMDEGEFVWDDPAIGERPLPDEDAVFGGHGDDVLWGGRGPDHVYGGHGEDFLDVRPRPATDERPADPPSWFTWVRVGDSQEHYQDSDVLYGGWGSDALQANLADTGPNDGDRLFDWAGVYNIYYVCPPVYGDWVITRSVAPGILRYFEDLSHGDGLPATSTRGSSGFDELGLVYQRDMRHNSNPPHPDTPGHFYCGDGTE